MKKCKDCNNLKTEEEFYPHRCVCKKCDYQRTRAYRAANRDKILAAGRARYQRNCEKLRAANKAWRQKDPARHNAARARWRQQNPLKARFTVMRVNAKKKGRQIPFTFEEWKRIFYDQSCAYCGGKSDGGIDRVNNQETYTIENCVPCCRLCNYIKRDLSLEQCFAHIRRMLAHSESKGLDNANL